MNRFISILQFLTRIPIKRDVPMEEAFHKGIIYFPVVGGIIGALLMVAYRGASLYLAHSLSALLTVGFFVFLTGGLHLDGLGDTFDGLYSNRNKETILEIMKDSRLGTNGVLAMVFILLLKLYGIQGLGEHQIYWGIILMPVMGRQAIVYGCYRTIYGRSQGLGHLFIGKVSKKELLISSLLTFILAAMHLPSLIFALLLPIGSQLYKGHVMKKIDGMTGDTLGSLCELTEGCYLLFILLITGAGLF
ncbi:adenosylcobinamide-GDP ribazoletransferase [Alkaliphilus metalliredigens]|nr:adenosylcobinamide-GDP ribazoletransferase [Alkaliphilus metalliredigens]